jgi:hypothetical protein
MMTEDDEFEHQPRPNAEAIRAHLEWLIAPARGAYDDALMEIAHGQPEGGPSAARLFGFDQLAEAADYAVRRNLDGRNVYVGAALRLPDADLNKRASADDFYVATAVPVDIDTDYDATRARMAAVCQDGLVVVTGLTPERRSQHWVRLAELCDSDAEFGHAFAGLVEHIGADVKVKDSARVMRLGGTVAYPNAKKVAAGYRVEVTALKINPDARPADINQLRSLAAGPAREGGRREFSDRPANDGVERGGLFGTGKVTDGRERFFATQLLPRLIREYQEAFGEDPSPEALWRSAFAAFQDEADNADGRWTSADGQRELRARVNNTLRRLKLGHLAHLRLWSRETGARKDEAEAAQAARDAAREQARQQSTAGDQAAADDDEFGPSAEAPPPQPEADDGPFAATTFTGEPPERRWIVPEWIVEGAVNSLYGDGGVGKTLIAQQLAYAVAVGGKWLGLQCAQGSVLAVLCEDEKGELHHRHQAIKAAMGYAVGNPFADVWLWPRVGFDNTLVRWDRDGKAALPPFYDKVLAQVRALNPRLLILDTLADIYGGSEIDRVQVNYFVKTVLGGLIREQAAAGHPLTVLLLGHPSVGGKADGRGFSGSTAWNNAVRARLYLTRPEDGDTNDRVLTRGKANYAASGDSTAIRLHFLDGALRPEVDVPEDSMDRVKSLVRSAVGNAFSTGKPFAARADYDRYIYKALPPELANEGVPEAVTRQAIQALIADNEITAKDDKSSKRGFRLVRK